MVDVVGVGANSVDYVYRLPTFPSPDGPSSKLRIAHHTVSPGGQTATTLCACTALGLETRYIGAIGNDQNGQLIRDELINRGVDVAHIATRETANAFAVILLDDRHGERAVLWDRTRKLDLEPNEIDPVVIRGARLVHVDDVDEGAAIRAASIAREAGIPVTSDIERIGARTEELLAAVNVPILAEHALEALTGEKEFERGLRAVRSARVKPGTTHDDTWDMVCVTLGARGAMLLARDRLHCVTGIPVEVVDTTGAGDVFRGAFIAALLRGDGPHEILQFANTAAAISCTRPGAIRGVPTLAETQALIARTAQRSATRGTQVTMD